jgi:hypothetical protein
MISLQTLTVLVLFLGAVEYREVSARRIINLIHPWFKTACLPANLKKSERYICDPYGKIICMPGWTNPENYCSDPVCDPPCYPGRGNCTQPNHCVCEIGWMGPDCSQCVCLPR